jgi:hypothetical protein
MTGKRRQSAAKGVDFCSILRTLFGKLLQRALSCQGESTSWSSPQALVITPGNATGVVVIEGPDAGFREGDPRKTKWHAVGEKFKIKWGSFASGTSPQPA